jgi:hypothetical protein
MKFSIRLLALIASSLATIVLVYLGVLFIAHRGNPDSLSIDSCLDSGGRWNYETRICEH